VAENRPALTNLNVAHARVKFAPKHHDTFPCSACRRVRDACGGRADSAKAPGAATIIPSETDARVRGSKSMLPKRKPDLRAPGIDHAGFALDASAAVCATNSLIGLHATLTAERLQAYVDRSTV